MKFLSMSDRRRAGAKRRNSTGVGNRVLSLLLAACLVPLLTGMVAIVPMSDVCNGDAHDLYTVITKQATCTEMGITSIRCNNCAYSSEGVINPPGHNYAPATCTVPQTCSNCSGTIGSELGHAWAAVWTTDVTGHWNECGRNSCGEINSFATHTPGSWIVDTPATGTNDGSRHKECTACGYTTETEVIPATGTAPTPSTPTPTPEPTPTPTPEPTPPPLTNPDDHILSAFEQGESYIVIDEDTGTVLSEDALQAIRDSDVPVQIELPNGLVITIDPATITDDARGVDLNIFITAQDINIDDMVFPAGYIVIMPSANGAFGFALSFTLEADYLKSAGFDVNKARLWYVSDDNIVSEKGSFVVNPDGSVTITIDSASYYIFSEDPPHEPAAPKPKQAAEPEPEPEEPDDTRAFVIRLYRVILGRTPQEEEMQGWIDALNDGTITGSFIADYFLTCPEITLYTVPTNAEFIEMLYNALLGRPSDPGPLGREGWIEALENGMSRAELTELFTSTIEFGQVCERYEIMV